MFFLLTEQTEFARSWMENVCDGVQVCVHHCQRDGQDGMLRVPQRGGQRPLPLRDARAAGDLRRLGGSAVAMEVAANDAHHDDDDDVMMPTPPRPPRPPPPPPPLMLPESERMPFQATSHAYIHYIHPYTRGVFPILCIRPPFHLPILPEAR